MLIKEFNIVIQASKAKVWFALWDLYHYRQWTAAFCEGSYAITDNWREGSRVHFLTPDGRGMYSDVTRNIPFEKMEFSHIGNIHDFKEMPLDEEAKEWSGGMERYHLEEIDGKVHLKVIHDVYEKYASFIETAFPKALGQVKLLAENFSITIQVNIRVNLDTIWEKWNEPQSICQWYVATETWHTPRAENDLRVGGKFSTRMEAKDGSFGFDFGGFYTIVEPRKRIEYTLEDGRKVQVHFTQENESVVITESFEGEDENPYEMQRDGWQAILNNFKKYIEGA